MNTNDLNDHEKEELQKFLQSVISECDQILYSRLEMIWKSELEKIKIRISHKDEKKAPKLATNLVKERLPGIMKQYEKEKEERCKRLEESKEV